MAILEFKIGYDELLIIQLINTRFCSVNKLCQYFNVSFVLSNITLNKFDFIIYLSKIEIIYNAIIG